MLETVLKIGKAFRESPEGYRYHRYIRPCPADTDKHQILRLSLPVNEDMSFNFNKITEILDENQLYNLFYLTFQTSDADTSIKYVYGDIYYNCSKGKEVGNYRIKNYDAFKRAELVMEDLENKKIINFRKTFKKQKKQIEKILEKKETVFLHFDFGAKHWFANDELDELNRLMLNHFCSDLNGGLVFDSMLYRTLCSGDPKNDIQFPNLKASEKYKSKQFTVKEAKNLFYAINYIERPSLFLSKNNYIVILPNGTNLNAEEFKNFSLSREEVIKLANDLQDKELLFVPLTEKIVGRIVAFDVIFVQKERVFSDLIEICGLEKSLIKEISKRILKIKISIEDKCKQKFSIRESFKHILADNTKDRKKYQSHLLKILPKIYTGTYYNDPVLLPALIQKTEENIRNDKANFNFIKYDFYFLIKIQNTKLEGENLMKIQESQSYKIGILLGELAKQFAAWREDCPMKSFEKSYVGTLSRRISTISDLINFKTFIDEKLILHERSSFTHLTTVALAAQIRKMEQSDDEKYDKNKCAFGFFESYFSSISKQNDTEYTKKIETVKL